MLVRFNQTFNAVLFPGGRPPTESLVDVRSTGFFESLSPYVTLHGDGNKAWKSEAKTRKRKFTDVAHVHMQFTAKRAGHAKLAGTQVLDQHWRHLKQHVPKSLGNRHADDRRCSARIRDYVLSYQWRVNAGKNLWKCLGDLCREV